MNYFFSPLIVDRWLFCYDTHKMQFMIRIMEFMKFAAFVIAIMWLMFLLFPLKLWELNCIIWLNHFSLDSFFTLFISWSVLWMYTAINQTMSLIETTLNMFFCVSSKNSTLGYYFQFFFSVELLKISHDMQQE